ncbi:hypothetical protein ACKKBG_A33535 [Auxenochlorella protothecoides x Auxenochlorella symbiontica]
MTAAPPAVEAQPLQARRALSELQAEITAVKEALADVDHLRQACIAALGLGVRMEEAHPAPTFCRDPGRAGSPVPEALASPAREASSPACSGQGTSGGECSSGQDEDGVPLAIRMRRLAQQAPAPAPPRKRSRLAGSRSASPPPTALQDAAARSHPPPPGSPTPSLASDSVEVLRCSSPSHGAQSAGHRDSTGAPGRESPQVIFLDEDGCAQSAAPASARPGDGAQDGRAGGGAATGNPRRPRAPTSQCQSQHAGLRPNLGKGGLAGLGIHRARSRAGPSQPAAPPGQQQAAVQEAAWRAAAAAWRQRNAPSASELTAAQRQASAAAAASLAAAAAARRMRTPAQRAAAAAGPGSGHGGAPPPPSLPRPGPEAPEGDWRAFFRAKHQAAAAGRRFEELLTRFGVPEARGAGLRERYRTALRLYHPDSNSAGRAWACPRQQMECEEIMKIINAQKPGTL